MKETILKNKIPIIIITIAFIIFLTVLIIYIKTNTVKNSSSELNSLTKLEDISSLNNTTENNNSEVTSSAQEIPEEVKEELPIQEEISTQNNTEDTKPNKVTKTTENNKSSTPVTQSSSSSNAHSTQSSTNKETTASTSTANPTETKPVENKPTETRPVENKITYTENTTYENKLVSAVKKYAQYNDLCVEYGCNVSISKNAMNYSTQFTYSENNVKGIVINGGTKYNVYARDYFVNGVYQWTECYCASVP
ncbi:MAG: hypothetical protein IKF97_05855 [Clostridia bacterium]|nr:hypothetical protein [Clostridia bacterium]